MLKSLLRSRKVLLAALGVIQTVVLHYFSVPAEVWASINALIVSVIASIAYEDGKQKEGAQRADPAAAPKAVGVILLLMLFAAPAVTAQTVTRTIDDRNSFAITSDSVHIQMAGVGRTVPRDLVALASVSAHQHDIWDLQALIVRSEHRDGPVEVPPFAPSELADALDELEALLNDAMANIARLRQERDDARDLVAPLQAEVDALRSENNAALARVRAWLDTYR